MTHTPRGLLSGSRLKERRRKFRYSRKVLKPRKTGNLNKYDPLVGAPQGTGIVLEKVQIEVKQPGSGLKKCVKVQLIKNGKVVTAFCAGEGAIKHIDEHDEVTIERIGGPQRGSMGDIPGVKFRVIKVAGISMPEILKGKKEKPVR